MDRELLVADAREAAKSAAHNLLVIRKRPEKMLPGKAREAEIHLNTMIYFSKMEMKNDRRSGQSQLRIRLKSLVVFILTLDRAERKRVSQAKEGYHVL